jgi:hypothetical protein
MNAQTKLILEIIEGMIDHAAGNLTPELDDIATELRDEIGGRHSEALSRVNRSLTTVLDRLTEDGWYWAKVTDYYIGKYRDLPAAERHPVTQAEIIRCVAGGGRATAAAAIHFCPGDDCVLVMQKFLLDTNSGEKKVVKSVRKMQSMAEAGQLTPDGITRIAVQADLGPRKDVHRAHRIAGRVQQQRLVLKAGES